MSLPRWPEFYLEGERNFCRVEEDAFYEQDSHEWREAHRPALFAKREEWRHQWIKKYGDWKSKDELF